MKKAAHGTHPVICQCPPSTRAKTYYVWKLTNKKQMIPAVTGLELTEDEVLFTIGPDELVHIPRNDVFMVTCQICSPPPVS
jgi:hypothetical protein